MKLTAALKEWAVAVEALQRGETIVLLRKGGIREEGGRFSVTHRQALLYPTYEHQKPELLDPDYKEKVTPVESGWHPETIRLGAWAEITDILPVSDPSELAALLPYHIWNDRMVGDRLKWKPRQPLYVLLLRTHKLQQPQIVAYRPEYGGCRSWIDLAAPISLEASAPVLSDSAYNSQVAAIRNLIDGEF